MDQVSWRYFFRDRNTAKLLAEEASQLEIQVDSVKIKRAVNFVGRGKSRLYEQVLAMVVRRCARFEEVYAKFVFNGQTNPTLVIPSWALSLNLDEGVQAESDRIIQRWRDDEHSLIRRICKVEDLIGDDFLQLLAFNIHTYVSFHFLGAKVLVVEDQLKREIVNVVPERFKRGKIPKWWENRYGRLLS